MSVSDQAFIRAYHDERPSFIAAPPVQRKSPPSEVPATLLRMACIHVGSTSVGAPHANFAKLTTHVAPSIPTSIGAAGSQAGSVFADANPAQASLSGDTWVRPHAPFGNSPKAALSTFVGQKAAPPAAELAKSAFEVDAVRWPAVCDVLLTRFADRFDQLADRLRRDAESGCKTVAISGIGRSEGRTTLALCLAKRMALQGATLALVDADFAAPAIAPRLSIGVGRGWESALAGEKTVWESMIESVADRFALAPLAERNPFEHSAPPVYRLAMAFSELADQFDLVLIDAGPLCPESATEQWLLEPSSGVQGVILVHDVRRGDATRLAAGCLHLADARQQQLGIVETFVSAEVGGQQ